MLRLDQKVRITRSRQIAKLNLCGDQTAMIGKTGIVSGIIRDIGSNGYKVSFDDKTTVYFPECMVARARG